MNKKSSTLIEIWDYHKPIPIDEGSGIVINIGHKKPDLPEDVEKRVNDNWDVFKKKNPRAKDNDIAYLVSYEHSNGKIIADVFTAGFKYNQYLNRDDKNMTDSKVTNELNYNPFGSWIIAICDNGKYALFGNKKDFGNKKVSGFGGFTSQEDIIDNKIDTNHLIQRILEREMKDVSSAIANKYIIGLNYFPIVGPKGFDGVYITELDGRVEKLQKHFNESDQFSKQLIPVRTDPKSLLSLLEHKYWEPTWSCIGGILNYIGSRYGKDELEKISLRYSKRSVIYIFDEPFNGNVKEKILQENEKNS